MKISIPRKYQTTTKHDTMEGLLNHRMHALFLDMGLGKTLISLYTAYDMHMNGLLQNVIVIMPKSILSVWKDEMIKHFKVSPPYFTWENSKVKTKKYLNSFEAFLRFQSNCFKVFLINIEAFQTKNEALKYMVKSYGKKKTLVIIDESSKIKTHSANRTKRLIEMFRDHMYKIILTGTEITNTILDLYSQFEFLRKGFWGMRNWYCFRAKYATLEEQYGAGGRKFKVVTGFKKIDELEATIKPYYTRLKKEDCLELPDKMTQLVNLDMSYEMRTLYDELKKNLFAEYQNKELTIKNKISLFTRFRQITGGFFPNLEELVKIKDNTKLDYLMDDMEDASNDKIIIWCVFKNEIRLLEDKIKKVHGKDSCVTFFGEKTLLEREQAIGRFAADKSCRYLIINPATGAFGLNLQFCSLVYYYSLDTSPERYWQSLDRVYRMGQKEKVLYKILLYKDSVDNRVHNLLTLKTALKDGFRNQTLEDFFKLI